MALSLDALKYHAIAPFDGTDQLLAKTDHEPRFHSIIEKLGRLLKNEGNDKELKKEIKVVSAEELNKIISEFTEANAAMLPLGGNRLLDFLSSHLDLESLTDGLKRSLPDLMKQVSSYCSVAKYHLAHLPEKNKNSFLSQIKKVFDGLVVLFDSFLVTYGVTDLFKTAEDSFDSQMKVQSLMMLSMLFSGLTSIAIPVLGPLAGALLVGGALLLLVMISLIWPKIKPLPAELPVSSENLSREVLKAPFEIEGREQTLNRMADILKMNKHPILIGPTRVGKTLTSRAFVNAVAKGKYPELKKLTFYAVNTTELLGRDLSFFGGGGTLKKICKAIEYREDEVCLVLDEVHNAGKEKLAERLKTLMDEGGKFRHVIGITTHSEYEQYIKTNPAFSARFVPVEVVNTDADETEKILSDAVLKSSLKPKIDSISYLYQKAAKDPTLPQPMASLTLLKKCMNKVSDTQQSLLDEEMTRIKIRMDSLNAKMAATGRKDPEMLRELQEVSRRLIDLEQESARQKGAIAQLYLTKKYHDQLDLKKNQLILKISKVQQNLSQKDAFNLLQYLLIDEYLIPALDSYLRSLSKQLGIELYIDEEMIDKLADV